MLQTSEAERIGVNQVARVLPSGNDSGSDQRKQAIQSTSKTFQDGNIDVQCDAKVLKGESKPLMPSSFKKHGMSFASSIQDPTSLRFGREHKAGRQLL